MISGYITTTYEKIGLDKSWQRR